DPQPSRLHRRGAHLPTAHAGARSIGTGRGRRPRDRADLSPGALRDPRRRRARLRHVRRGGARGTAAVRISAIRTAGGPVDAGEEAKEPKEQAPPRLRVTKGAPWRIDPGRRAKWSAPEFVSANAVEVRQIGDPVLHAPAKKPRLSRADLEALVARMFASMVVARGIGIAAPQIGVALRVAIMDVDEAGIVAIEPTVEWTS